MKKILPSLLASLLLIGPVQAAAPACPAACDSHWKGCASRCGSGPNAFACKTSCGGQHEDCLDGCNKATAASSGPRTLRYQPAAGGLGGKKLPAAQHADE